MSLEASGSLLRKVERVLPELVSRDSSAHLYEMSVMYSLSNSSSQGAETFPWMSMRR